MVEYSSYFFVAFIISLFIQHFMIRQAHEKNIFLDGVQKHKRHNIHTHLTPRAGGVGIFFASLGILFTSLDWLILSGIIIFFIGLYEDFRAILSPHIRLILQILAVVAVMASGDILIFEFGLPFNIHIAILLFLTGFVIIGLSNAMNIIDGLNGLSSGIALLAFISFAYLSYFVHDYEIFMVCLIFIGAISGFMAFNFPLGKIFLGDGGAYFLGFMIACLGILLSQRHNNDIRIWFCLVTVIYPVWEVAFSIYRRKFIQKVPAMSPDKLHFHTLLYKSIGSNPKASALLLFVVALFDGIAIFVSEDRALLITVCGVFIVSYSVCYRLLVNKLSTKQKVREQ